MAGAGNGDDHEPGFNLFLSGGWNAACSSQTLSAAATMIDGGGEHLLFEVGSNGSGEVRISNLSFVRGKDTGNHPVFSIHAINSTANFWLDNLRLVDNFRFIDGNQSLHRVLAGAGTLRIRSVLVANNFSDHQTGMFVHSDGYVYMNNNVRGYQPDHEEQPYRHHER